VRKFTGKIVALASRSCRLAELCRTISHHHAGENVFDFAANGEAQFLNTTVPHAKLIFDVGANSGHWIQLALAANPHLRIHAFEPCRQTFAQLAARRFPANVTLNNVGCGAHAGSAMLHYGGSSPGFYSVVHRAGVASGEVEGIRLITLDDYCDQFGITDIDLVKVDVEGYELEVVKGMTRLLSEGRVRAVQFEYGATYIDAGIFLKNVWEFVLSCNPDYQFSKLHARGLIPLSGYSPNLENFAYANYVAQVPW
jgi:FkbM family methyltransferase